MKRITPLLLSLLLFLAACASGSDSFTPDDVAEPGAGAAPTVAEATAAPAADDEAAAAAGTTVPVDDPTLARERDWKKGDLTDPAVTIIEYGDFQCPGCAGFAPVLKQLVDAYPDDVQIIFRHFPLTSIHPNAQKSAEAAEAAGAQGQFWQYHDALYERQAEWSALSADEARQFFIDLAGELGLDSDTFAAALDNGDFAAYVSASEQEATALGLPGTPSAIINGQIFPGESLPRESEAWEAFVNDEIKIQQLKARQFQSAPPMTINSDARYLAHVEMANGGAFTIELLPQSAPQTVNSFVFLAREGWFDGVTFHRVLPGFVAQTGDPTGTGRGGPGYMIPNEIDSSLSHNEAGVVAMANAGPNTNGSQWYITYGDVSQLDGSYTIFGRVIEGMDVVEAITPRDPSRTPNAPAGDAIARITIEEIAP